MCATGDRRAFITGGSGLVGYQCAVAFRDAGWVVVATHCSFPTPTTVQYDCAHPKNPENFDVEAFKPHIIIHCAAKTHVDECERDPEASYLINVEAVKLMAEVAKKCSAKMVFISSDYVFDGVAGPYSEDAVPCPLNVYGKHKLEAENYLLGKQDISQLKMLARDEQNVSLTSNTNLELYNDRHGNESGQATVKAVSPLSALNVLILRVTNIYGQDAGRNKNFVSRIAGNAKKNIDGSMIMRLPSDQYATPIDAIDISTIIKMLIEDKKCGLYHLAAPEYLSRVQLAVKVLQQVPGNNAEILPVETTQLEQKAQRPLRGGLLSSRLQTEYPKFLFRTVDEFLHNTIQTEVTLARNSRALPGLYSQYDKPGKYWYAPNKFEAYGEEEINAVVECLRDGFLAPGPRTEQFEASVSRLYGKKFGLMVNSGSAANLIALSAFGFKPGDEVITPAFTFSTTLAPLVQLGVTPIFVDVEEGTYVPSVNAVTKAITPRTVLIWLPNLVGSKPDWEGLRKQTSLKLWEDSCDTITETKITDLSITSFYASHMITAGGGGGMIMANDEKFIEKCRMYRDWGRIGNNSEDLNERFANNEVDGIPYDRKFLYGVVGYNCKSTEMNAAFGNVQVDKFPRFRKIRRDNFDRMLENLQGTNYFGLPLEPQGIPFDWLAFPLTCPDREEILHYLEGNNIQTRVIFSGNITRHPAYRELYFESQGGNHMFPIADKLMAEGFLIGCHHGLSLQQVDRVCNLLKAFEKMKMCQ